MELRYSPDGKTIDSTDYYANGDVAGPTTYYVDDRGHVTRVVIRQQDWKTKKPKPPLNVTFRYDAKGRLIEQITDEHEIEGGGVEHEPPPGKVSISYDDVKHTKTTTYAGKLGSLTMTIAYDASGATIAMSGGTSDNSLDAKLECAYDSRGNWTACQQIVKRAGVSTVMKMWRRTITYR